MVLFCLKMLFEFDFLGGRRLVLSGGTALLDSRALPVAALISLGIVSQSSLFCEEFPFAIFEFIIGEHMFGISPHVLIFIFFINKLAINNYTLNLIC